MRYKLIVSYDGSNYFGFQIQPNKDTIQSRLEGAMEQVYGEHIDVVASGRTDAGVSALSQVCHFDTDKDVDERKNVGYLNALLPSDISVISIEKVDDSFHARKGAKRKTYVYYFYVGKKIPVYDKMATNIGRELDIEAMKKAGEYLVGTHDFSAFCASNTAVVDKVRTIYSLEILPAQERLYKMEITGSGFLYNMVRIIMGTLVAVGMGKLEPNDMPKIISSLDRGKAGKTMPSKGLYLKKVMYTNN